MGFVMGDAAETLELTYAQYLSLEAETGGRHEWLGGRVYAMAGGSPEHALLASAVGAELHRLARARGCRVASSDLKVRVLATGLATYADVTVLCGALERDPADPNAVTNPTVLVEVLSDGTELYDRGEKFLHYQRVPSLRHYLLVSQREPRVELYSREGDRWVYLQVGAGESVELAALGGALSVDAVYAGIELQPSPLRRLR